MLISYYIFINFSLKINYSYVFCFADCNIFHANSELINKPTLKQYIVTANKFCQVKLTD